MITYVTYKVYLPKELNLNPIKPQVTSHQVALGVQLLHLCDVKINHRFLWCLAFSPSEESPIDICLGLPWLRSG